MCILSEANCELIASKLGIYVSEEIQPERL